MYERSFHWHPLDNEGADPERRLGTLASSFQIFKLGVSWYIALSLSPKITHALLSYGRGDDEWVGRRFVGLRE